MQPACAAIFVQRRTIFLVPQVFSDCYRGPKIEGKSAHRAEKSRRRDADDRERVLIYADGFADDAPIASELFLPKVMAQYHHRERPRLLRFFGGEESPELR